MKIAIQGYEGSYHDTVRQCIFKQSEIHSCNTFHDVVLSVASGVAYYGIMAIENSIYGDTAASLELRSNFHGLEIVGELVLDITHCLVGSRHSELVQISSHQVAIGQCRKTLREKYPDVDLVESEDTAFAAKHVSEKIQKGIKSHAAIASREVLKLYPNLELLDDDITDYENNFTRFIVFAKRGLQHPLLPDNSNEEKTTALLTISDTKSSLLSVLQVFDDLDINFTNLQANSFRYDSREGIIVIPIEFHHSWHDNRIIDAIKELKNQGASLQSLGTYRVGKVIEI